MPKTIPGHAQSCCSQDETPFGLVHCTLKTLSWADSPWKMVVERVDPRMKPYLELIRFDKPIGTALMFWPSAWGLTMAAYRTQMPIGAYIHNTLICLMGAFILRSAACTINDIVDRETDAGVERTKNRPLASGRISVGAAVVFLLVQYALGISFFYWTTGSKLAYLAALMQLIPLFGIYPFLKRITYWPQAWLGIAMNVGFVTSWLSHTGTIDIPLITAAMAGCWCWTMLYDTIYACQDVKDDIKMGVRSTALLFGDWVPVLLALCATLCVCMVGTMGYLNSQGPPFFVCSVLGATFQLSWQMYSVNLNSPASCWYIFRMNSQLGWVVWGGLAIDYLCVQLCSGLFCSGVKA